MKIFILPSAIVDIVRIRCFYDGLEIGLGTRFQDYIFGEIDKLEDNAGIDEVHFGYYRALANRFHQSIYYRGTCKTREGQRPCCPCVGESRAARTLPLPCTRFCKCLYKIDGDDVTVWRVLDQRFNPRRIESALTSPNDDE